MKIFYLIAKSEQGGAQTHVYQLCSFFIEKGNEVAVMTFDHNEWLGKEAKKLGVKFYPNKYIGNTLNPYRIFLSFLEIKKAIKEFNPDIVHCHSFMGGLLGRLAVRGKIPTVFTPHGWGFNVGTPFLRKITAIVFEKINSRFTDRFICVSNFGKNLALKYNIAPAKKISVIYNGIEDLKVKEKCGHSDKKIDIVFVGRLAKPKRVDMLLGSIKLIENKEKINVVVVGSGPQENYLHSLVKDLDLENIVKFTGALSRDQVFDIFCENSDIFVLLSDWEGLPITVLEAMSAGLPVIASNVGGIPELVDKNNGFLIDRNDVKGLIEALEKLINDERLRHEMGKSSRQKIKENFTLSKMLKDVEKIYLNITV